MGVHVKIPNQAKHDMATGLGEVLMTWLGPRLESRGRGGEPAGEEEHRSSPCTALPA